MVHYNQISSPLCNQTSQLLISLYDLHRDECSYWLMQRFGIGKEDAMDVFQNTVITLFQKLQSGDVRLPATNLKGYLYGVARNKGHEYLRSRDRYVTHNPLPAFDQEEEHAIQQQKESKQKLVERSLTLLPSGSSAIIKLYYKDQMSIRDITSTLGYKNHDTTKNIKYKSLQRLRKIVTPAWQHLSALA